MRIVRLRRRAFQYLQFTKLVRIVKQGIQQLNTL